MRITHLSLRNYRVYEELELDLPPGLVGIYGPNGGGKSTLVEAIRFALYGQARTTKDEIRSSGVGEECRAELEFEHEGHLYRVRRTIAGINHTVKAAAFADGLQVAEGAQDTKRYVHSVLGMDDAAFRASVFAEQKQLASFSERRPEERRALVLQLLGITPVDAARDRARSDARDTRTQHDKLRSVLPDLEARRAEAAELAEVARSAGEAAVSATTAADVARAAAEAVSEAFDRLDALRQEHELLVAEGRAKAEEVADRRLRVANMEAELADLESAAGALDRARPEADGLAAAEARLRAAEDVAAARQAVSGVSVPPEPPPPDEAGAEEARARQSHAQAALAEVEGALGPARAGRDRAAEAVSRSAELTGEADCPLCGQALGDAFAQVQAHRGDDLAAAEARVAELQGRRAAHAQAVAEATASARRAVEGVVAARVARQAYEQASARRRDAEQRLVEALADAAKAGADPGSLAELRADVGRRRRAAEDVARLSGRLERRPALQRDLGGERLALAEGEGILSTLREKVAGLGFRPATLAAARAARDEARQGATAAERAAEAARTAAARSTAEAEAGQRRVVEAEGQHVQLATLAEDVRHLSRVAELLGAFRNELVASVGPRLSTLAAELFAQLTDREYDELLVDPDTYEIRVRDRGREHGMDRFSGSEIDLANLALRVAISEQVRFQAGGTVGLLVLDEVFGPLDEERKARMLHALHALGARFRQVLVVTHDAAVKEQLPNALEVQKLPGRRATVRLLTA